jgi:hypothetical protein
VEEDASGRNQMYFTDLAGPSGFPPAAAVDFTSDGECAATVVFIRFYNALCQCPPCNAFADAYEQLSARHASPAGAHFLTAGVQSNATAVTSLNISRASTTVAFRARREVGRYCGKDPAELEDFICGMLYGGTCQ